MINRSKKEKIDFLEHLNGYLTENRMQRFETVLNQRTNHFTVAVEDVFQMHNTSAVMRSCEVFGVQNLHVIEEKYAKTIDRQIAMGAQKWVDITSYDNSKNCIASLKEKGYQIIATTPHANDNLIHEFDITKPAALFFGTEKEGLSQEIIDQADGFLKIPMVGFTESLNISVSAAIILQNLTNRLRLSTIEWELSEDEKLEKRIDWAKKTIKDSVYIEKVFWENYKNK